MNDQDPPVFGRDMQEVDGSEQCPVFTVSAFQSAWTTLQTLSQQFS